ncbi:hypothetical protein Tco_0312113 [Tanacetum coccineum]
MRARSILAIESFEFEFKPLDAVDDVDKVLAGNSVGKRLGKVCPLLYFETLKELQPQSLRLIFTFVV